MQNLEMLAKLHDVIKRVHHLSVLRTTTTCPVDKMYGTTPMPEFIDALKNDVFDLFRDGADKILKEVKAQGELEFYLHAVDYMREPASMESMRELSGMALLTYALNISQIDLNKIEEELYKYNN